MKRFYEYLNESLKGKDIVTVIRVAKAENVWSSQDRTMCAYGDRTMDAGSRFELRGLRTSDVEFQGRIIKVIDATISGDFRREWKKPQIDEVAAWLESKGFFRGLPDELRDTYDLNLSKRAITDEKRRKDEGYVLWMRTPTTKDYVGGFTLETFFEDTLISYVERGLTFGYVGHRGRKAWMDQIMESVCLEKIKPDDFAVWLTSTAGRHFVDATEKFAESDDKRGFEKFVRDNLAKIHDQAIVFSYPGHGGTLKDSTEIFAKLKSAGLTMADKYEYGW